jgi:hypothetical protein
MEWHSAGRDELGRNVRSAFVADFAEIPHLAYPEIPFVILLGGATHELPVDAIYATAGALLDRGAVYFLCWGEGASRCEDVIDEAATMKWIDAPQLVPIMTTAHEEDSLRDVLQFATSVAVPAEPFAHLCADVLLVFHGNAAAYDEARRILEEMHRARP